MKRIMRALCSTLVLGLLVHHGPGEASELRSEFPCPAIEYDISSYDSHGKRILVERYQPSRDGKFPVVIFVHGAGGVFSRRNPVPMPEFDNFGEKQTVEIMWQ